MALLNYSGKFDAKLSADGSGLHSPGHAHVETITKHATHAPADAIIVPDTQLLFNGDFKRSGVDLILSRDGHELVLHDYFKGEKRASLSSPDGAHLTGDIVGALTGHTEYAQADGSASAGKVIGHVTKLTGSASAIRNGVSIILNNGDNVEKGDVVQSGSNSTLGITFIDGTVFGLASNARMVLNEMVYDPNGSNNSSLLSLVAGTITFVAGETAKHGDMKVDTPVATMGIRGTAVLVEIDFSIPGQGGAPDAKFQVLVEPDGTTGSYILFDKNTLTPIATVNQAGQQINITQGVLSITNAPLPPDVQKLINDVFTLKFTDNSNPKTFDHFTDTVVPQSLQPIMLANGATAIPVIINVNTTDNTLTSGPGGPTNTQQHIPGPPTAVILDFTGQPASAFHVTELVGKTGDATNLDTVSGQVNFLDINPGDAPTVSAKFASFTYQNAAHNDLTATLNAKQLADIAALEVKLALVPDPGNKNHGSVMWTYSVADSAADFLAAGETLTLTYTATVDNNFAPNDETTTLTFTITITGTNDVPVITTGPQLVSFSGGTSVPGGNLTANVPTSGTLAFTDVDLTDTHTVSTKLTGAALSGPGSLAPGPLAIFETALSATVAKDSTGTGTGAISWKLADLPVYLADFIPKGETLTLTYAVTVTDSQNTTSTQIVTVTITGTDSAAVVWIHTTGDGSPNALWSTAQNWETGTVPTLGDDVIIITDQLHGLTPAYPVTIDAAAFANSVTMNDFDLSNPLHSQPELDNLSTLTISGALTLSADSIIHNSGIISVGGKAEMLNQSVLLNSGTIDLAQGGDFKDDSSITNTGTGTIEVSGGTLNVLVDIANAGLVKVDAPAALNLNGATIDGGTLRVSGTLDSTGTSALTDVDITNTGLIESTGGILTIDPATLINSGTLEANGGELDLTGETVTNTGLMQAIDDSTLKLTSTTVTNTGGTVAVESGSTLDLVSATISGGTITDDGLIDVAGSSTINNAVLNHGDVTIESDVTLMLDNVTVNGTTITGADTSSIIQIDDDTTLTLSGVTINGGTVNDGTADGRGSIDVTGDSTISNADLNNGGVTVESDVTLTLDNDTVTGTTITGNDASSIIQVDGGTTLTLSGAIIRGGTLSVSGTLDSTGTSAIDGAAITIADSGLFEVTGGTLTIDATSSVTNTGLGTFEVNGGNLIIDGTLAGNAEIVGASFLELGDGALGAYSAATITFASGATGTLKLDHAEAFSGTISGLDDNTLDLGDIAYGANVTVCYAAGILSIFKGGTEVADIHLSGDYTGVHWSVTSDGHGGTDVMELPGAITAGLELERQRDRRRRGHGFHHRWRPTRNQCHLHVPDFCRWRRDLAHGPDRQQCELHADRSGRRQPAAGARRVQR